MKKVREGYKKTLAGEIPEEWGYEELNKLVDKITDGTHKTPTYTESGIPFLRVTDIQKSEIDWSNVKYISQEEHVELIKRCNPEIGDILYSKNGTIGIPKIIDWDNEFSIFVSLCLIKMKKQESCIYNKYLEQFLKSDSCMRQIRLRAKQGTVTNLHLEEIRELIIPIPTIKEQEKIASILSTVDEQIDNIDALIEKNKELKKGLMQTLLTKGIGHTKFKKTEIGEIPEAWEVIKLNKYGYIFGGNAFKSSSFTTEYRENNYQVIRMGNVQLGKLNLEKNPVFLSENLVGEKEKKYLLKETDILISLTGTVNKTDYGNISWVDKNNKYLLNQRVGCLRNDNREFNNRYYYYFLQSNIFRKQFFECGVGGTGNQANVSIADLNNIKVLKLPIIEQEKIASILLEVDIKIEKFQSKKQRLEELKKGLMQQLLNGKIRV